MEGIKIVQKVSQPLLVFIEQQQHVTKTAENKGKIVPSVMSISISGGKSFSVLVQMYLYCPKQYLRNYGADLAEVCVDV